MRMRLGSLLAWTVLPALLVGLIGAYPTWRYGGLPGLLGQAAAGCIVILAMVASAAVVMRRASGGAGQAALAFMLTAALRVAMCMILGLAAAFLLPLSKVAMLAWLGAFYVVSLLGECAWLIKTLRRTTEGSTGSIGASAVLK